MKRFAVGLLLLNLVACGGGNSPTTPSTPYTPPAPQYPSLLGAWAGTHSVTAVGSGIQTSATCNHTWMVDSQSAGAFSGTWQTTGTSPGCSQAGTVNGTIGTSGAISGLRLTATVGATGCTRTRGDGLFNGSLSGSTITATTQDTVLCGSVSADRAFTVRVSR